jgi:hypothetical protein
MSLVGLSLRASRRMFVGSNPFRGFHVSGRRFDNDNSDKAKEAKEKLNQLLKDIKESKLKRHEGQDSAEGTFSADVVNELPSPPANPTTVLWPALKTY